MPNIFGWLGTRQQRDIMALIPSHVEKVTQVVTMLNDVVHAFTEGDMAKVAEMPAAISRVEQEADGLRRELLRRLSEGLFVPADRTDLVQLVERMDTIADYANSAARMLDLFSDPAPEPLRAPLAEMTRILIKAVAALAEAFEMLAQNKGAEALARCDDVEAAEEEADRQKHRLLRILYSLDLPANQLLLLHDLIEALENTADRTEDSADLVRVLAVNLR